MQLSDQSRPLFRAAGGVVWVAAGAVLPACEGRPGLLAPTLLAFAAFIAGFWRLTSARPPAAGASTAMWLAIECVASLVLVVLHPLLMVVNLLVVVGWQAALLLPARAAIAWIVVQSALPGALLARDGDAAQVWAYVLGIVSFQLFGLVTARIVARERSLSSSRDQALQDLRIAQAALAGAAREAERLRIAREIHDVLGHQLTGLSMQLAVAERLGPVAGQAHAAQARVLADELLGQVRAVVAQTRTGDGFDLRRAVDLLVAGTPALSIQSRLDEGASALPPAQALVVLRIVQEGLTNVMRHAAARAVTLAVAVRDGEVQVHLADDGRGTETLRLGYGLSGMRERLAALGGTLDVDSRPGAGFALHARFPRKAGT